MVYICWYVYIGWCLPAQLSRPCFGWIGGKKDSQIDWSAFIQYWKCCFFFAFLPVVFQCPYHFWLGSWYECSHGPRQLCQTTAKKSNIPKHEKGFAYVDGLFHGPFSKFRMIRGTSIIPRRWNAPLDCQY